MYQRKHKLHTDKATVSKFGFLYLGYSANTYYWEAIVMLRKVSMVMIDVVLGPSGVGVQALVSQLMMSMMFIATLQYQPFEAPHIGRLELFSLSTSFMTLWMGSFFWASDNAPFATVVSVLIVIINIVFVLFLFITLVGDAFRDYEVVKNVKEIGRKTYLRASSLTSRSSSTSSTMGKGKARGRKKGRRGNKQKNTPDEDSVWSSDRGEEGNGARHRANSLPKSQIDWPEGEVKTFDNPMKNKKDKNNSGGGKSLKPREVELVPMSKPASKPAAKPASIAGFAPAPSKPHRRISTASKGATGGSIKPASKPAFKPVSKPVSKPAAKSASKPASSADAPKSTKPHRRISTKMPPGWVKHVAEDGRRYYEDLVEHSTSWTPPEGATGGSTGRTAADVDNDAALEDDTAPGECNEIKILVKPEAATAEAKDTEEDGQHVRDETFIPPGWLRHMNEHGRPYYQTPEGKTQWETPPGN
jgi:hypothetical protein